MLGFWEDTIIYLMFVWIPVILLLGLSLKSQYKSDSILSKLQSLPTNLEIIEYNPRRDKLLFTIGTENELPPPEEFERIKETLDKLEDFKVLIVPGIIKVCVLKNEKKK